MAASFRNVSNVLSNLEDNSFDVIRRSFRWPSELRPYLRGSIQCFAVDRPRAATEDALLPVVCAVGVNYTQNGCCRTELFPYEEGGAGVIRATASTSSVISVVSAYERNRDTWVSRKAVKPESPLEFYGSPDATAKTGPLTKGAFILIMTNLCPFITMTEWAKQPRSVSARLLQECSAYDHMDDLYDLLGADVDLWIGHSAIGGTHWVWPAFASFVRRRGIQEWLLTFNISPRSHRWFEDYFRRPDNPRYPWYGPRKALLARYQAAPNIAVRLPRAVERSYRALEKDCRTEHRGTPICGPLRWLGKRFGHADGLGLDTALGRSRAAANGFTPLRQRFPTSRRQGAKCMSFANDPHLMAAKLDMHFGGTEILLKAGR